MDDEQLFKELKQVKAEIARLESARLNYWNNWQGRRSRFHNWPRALDHRPGSDLADPSHLEPGSRIVAPLRNSTSG